MDFSCITSYAQQAFNTTKKEDFVVVFIPEDYKPDFQLENPQEYIELKDAINYSSSNNNSRSVSPESTYYNNAENNV
jgi:hypothetical protein